MLYVMADNNINISASRDGAMYNSFANNTDYVISGIGEELECTYNGFNVTLGTGEAIICGRHVTELLEEGSTTTLTVGASETGYIVLRVDLSKPAGYEAYLYNTPTLRNENLNNGGIVHDLALYRYTSGASGITALTSMRNVSTSPLDTKVNRSGDTMSGQLTIKGTATAKPLRVKGISGCSDNGTEDGPLYLNYRNNNRVILGADGGYYISQDGSQYTGNANNVYGVVSAANGGHGKTSLKDGATALIGSLDDAAAAVVDDTQIITNGVGEGFTISFFKRKASAIAAYIKNKFLGYSTGSGTINTTYVRTGGTIAWYKQAIGDKAICTVSFDVTFKANTSSDNVAIIGTGVPVPVGGGFIFPVVGVSEVDVPRINIDNDAIKPWYCGTVSGHWFGAITYLCNK